jgi:hypothetical protein
MTMAQQTHPDNVAFASWAKQVEGDPTMSVKEMEKLREEMAKTRLVPAPSPLPPSGMLPNYRFIKTGPMEYEATNKDILNILTGMLDMLQLGYTINTDYGVAGKISRWVITIYDPATMQEIAR